MRHKNYQLIVLIAIFLLIFAWLTLSVQYCGWDYHNSLWGPVNMLVHGSTPYSLNPPYGPFPAVWMPHTLGALFWFGLFPCTVSSSLWLLLEMFGFVWMIWLFNDYKSPAIWVFVVCLLALFLFPSLWVHIVLGQFSMLFAILMLVVVYVPGAKRWIPVLLALGLTKPQLGLLVYPGLVVHTWRHQGFRQAVWLMLSTAICVAVMTIPLFVFYPTWLDGFVLVTIDNFDTHWGLPTLFVQLPMLLGKSGYLIWGAVFLATMGLSLWIWYSKDKKEAVLLSLALTPLATTYASSWDFMLLLPAFYWLVLNIKVKAARAILLTGAGLVYVFQYIARWKHDIPDGSQWWIMPAMVSVFLAVWLVEHAVRSNLKGDQLSPENGSS